MTKLQNQMDSARALFDNHFLEDIMSSEELEKHEQEEHAWRRRNFKHGMATKRNKYAKFDRFTELATNHKRIDFNILKSYDLNVNDVVSIAYSIIAEYLFGGNAHDVMDWVTSEQFVNSEKDISEIVRECSKKYAYLEEVMNIAFTKHRGGKLNRSIAKLNKFFNSIDEERNPQRLNIRNFYANHNGASEYVSMVHHIICAYKFDNRDNEKLQRPVLFDYDNRTSKPDNFCEFYSLVCYEIETDEMLKQPIAATEMLNAFIKYDYYHYSEISLIRDICKTKREDVFKLLL